MPKLRLAYIGARWDYGDARRGESFEEVTFRRALEGMGHEVHAYDFLTRFQELGRDRMNEELDRFVRDVAPDMAVFILFKDEIAVDTIRRLTKAGILTFNWFCDDHWRFESFSQHYAPAFSMVSTTCEEAIPKYHALGYREVVLSQWALNRYIYKPKGLPLGYDATFVGQKYGDRGKIVRQIQKAGISVACWGFGWEQGRLSTEEMVSVYESSRVNINMSSSWPGRLWRRRPPSRQIKARVFEVPGSGGFLLTENAPHLSEYLAPGAEIGTYENVGEIVEHVRYWLDHEQERAAAAAAAHRRVLAEHTYDHRFAEIFRKAGIA